MVQGLGFRLGGREGLLEEEEVRVGVCGCSARKGGTVQRGREGGRKGVKVGGREGGREGGRKGGREGRREILIVRDL
jgi:hypothetical protein